MSKHELVSARKRTFLNLELVMMDLPVSSGSMVVKPKRGITAHWQERTESECFVVACDALLEICHPGLLIASENHICKVVEGGEPIWVTRRTESQCLIGVCDALLEILHPTGLLITGENCIRKLVEGYGTTRVTRRTDSAHLQGC